MDDSFTVSTPMAGYEVAPATLFGHPTRRVDAWTLDIERVMLPGFVVRESPFSVFVETDVSEPPLPPLANGLRGRLRRAAKTVVQRRAGRARPLEIDGDYLFDCRELCLPNVDRLIRLVLMIRRAENLIASHTGSEATIRLVMHRGSGSFAERMPEYCRIPTVVCSGYVSGRIVRSEWLLPRRVDWPLPVPDDGAPSIDVGPKVFISRRSGRGLINESEVRELLEARGFESVCFEDISFQAQAQVVRDADTIVAVHGAALAWLQARFRQETNDSKTPLGLVELFNAGYIVTPFRQATALLGGAWARVRSQVTPEVARDLDLKNLPRSHANEPFAVSLECVEAAIDDIAHRRRTPRSLEPMGAK